MLRIPGIGRRSFGLALSLGLVALSWQSQAAIIVMGNDLPTEPMPLSVEEKRYLKFGEVTYDFYSDQRFEAINKLLINQKQGLFNQDTEYAELILGTLYVNFGMPDQADVIFNRLLEKDILAQTRARTWLEKAMLEYRRGDYEKSAAVLASSKTDGLPPEEDARRHLTLANIRIRQEEFGEALASLHAIPGQTLEGGYATYNMGVSMIRTGHEKEGVQMLTSVIALKPGNEEINALKDRAALAVGLTELKAGHYERARSALLTIRVDGPFSNEALLALGMTNYKRGETGKALPVWLELVRRNPGHTSVQEALLLAPRAYEELGALPQALAGYDYASKVYREELKQVERAIRHIDDPAWLEKLRGTSGAGFNNKDPMAVNTSYSVEGGPEMAYLYKLFASHEFNELFRQYVELDRMQRLLHAWQDEMPALMETFVNQQAKLTANLPGVRSQLVNVRKNQQLMAELAADLSVNIPQFLDMNQPQDLASWPQLVKWEKIQQIDRAIAQGKEISALQRERYRRVRGVLLYNIAESSLANREAQIQDTSSLIENSDLTGVRVEALEQLVKDATLHTRGNIAGQLNSRRGNIDEMIERTDTLMDKLGQVMKNSALRVLAQSRRTLGDQLGEAHLALARIQDAAVVEKIERGIGK